MKKSESPIKVTFWGTRGSIAVPGPKTLYYGGNTSCVEVCWKNHFLILDAGTGIRALGLKLRKKEGEWSILITHPHMDHIGGLPFFAPALHRKTHLKIFGPPGLKKVLTQIFPFSILPSRKEIFEKRGGKILNKIFHVEACLVNHPGGALAYKIRTPFKTIVYISDHEPSEKFRHSEKAPTSRKLASWLHQADLLIMDAQYLDSEYKHRRGWGHSPLSYAVDLALKAKVKELILTHHDPSHSDKMLHQKLKQAQQRVNTSGQRLGVKLAREGQSVFL